MKHLAAGLAAGAALMMIACGDSTGPGDGIEGRYSLVRLGAATPPIAGMRPQDGASGVICADTMYSHVIALRAGGVSALETGQTTFCPGQAPQPSGGTVAGTWSARGDSVFIRYIGGTPPGEPTGPPFTVQIDGVLEGDDLVFRYPVYTEADPDGSSGLTYDIVYRRQE